MHSFGAFEVGAASSFHGMLFSCSPDPRIRSHGFYRAHGWRPDGRKLDNGDEILVLTRPPVSATRESLPQGHRVPSFRGTMPTLPACIAVASLVPGLAAANPDSLRLPHPAKPGPDPDGVPFITETNGVMDIPWGAGNYRWPEQMFWESMSQVRDKHLEMTNGGDAMEKQGKVPVMSCVAWGYEYTAATGGDASLGFADMSQTEGWKQW